MLILVGPSASGKTAVVKELIKKFNMEKFVTCTTRTPRVGEVEGVDYYFLTKEEFEVKYKKKEFIETVSYNGNYYGTLKSEAKENKVVILEPVGVKNFYKELDHLFSVYLDTPEALRESRMRRRGDSKLDIALRLENDRLHFNAEELEQINFIIDTENKSISEIAKIIYEEYERFLERGDLWQEIQTQD